MASIRKERTIEAKSDEVWAALRDWGALHERLVPGFVVDAQLDGEDRIVTFFNDAVARERLIDLSDEDRRLVWSIVDGPYTHHNGAAQVLAGEDGTTRFVWIADLLPDHLAQVTDGLMERGIETVKRTLEAAGATR
ncbi:MAG TPA: SRPBCC family protein [Solirubrobacterales bacterium]|nr:SRPBCC family protein [Solirubrobacterales bacterium]